MTTYILIIDF